MESKDKKLRVCVIGAGPSGMSALYYFAKLGIHSPEVICYEKEATWGGQWNYTWRTGYNEYGEDVCSGIYREMWVDIPKELMELAHYTFDKHFGKPIQSHFSAAVLMDYFKGYWKSAQTDLTKMIRFNTSVFSVSYNHDTDDFTVVTKDLIQRKHNTPEVFSHVIVASGNLQRPNVPDFKGFNTFHGRIFHSRDFKDGREFKGKRVLIIGGMYSAEDIALQCFKYSADHVIISSKTPPRGLGYPESIEERPLLEEVHGSIVTFKNGSTAEVDVIILCTGYMYSYSFLEDTLRIEETFPSLVPENLYKGVVWCKGGNNKLLYLGAMKIVFTFPAFEAQAVWAVTFITGLSPVSFTDKKEVRLNVDPEILDAYMTRMKEAVSTVIDEPTAVRFYTDYVRELADDTGYVTDIEGMAELAMKYFEYKKDILEHRNIQYTSVYTKKMATPVKTKWLKSTDASLQAFV